MEMFRSILALLLAAQLPASFQIPTMGYFFDADSRSIRTIAGIPGNARLDAPLALSMSVEKAALLPDQWHAIVASADLDGVVVVDLRELKTLPISGTSSSVSEIRVSPGGSTAALFYAAARKVVVVSGLPDMPVNQATIDISVPSGTLKQFAVADDGTTLLSFTSPDAEQLYRWSEVAGLQYVANTSRISSMTFLGPDAVYADAGSDQAFRIPNVRETSVPTLVADSGDGVSNPVAVYGSVRNEILIGNAGGLLLVLNASGHPIRSFHCHCEITTFAPLAKSALLLTDRIDQPLYVLDSSNDQVFFIPALRKDVEPGAGQ